MLRGVKKNDDKNVVKKKAEKKGKRLEEEGVEKAGSDKKLEAEATHTEIIIQSDWCN